MIYQKISALILSLLIVLSFTACQRESSFENPVENPTHKISDEFSGDILNESMISTYSSAVDNTETTVSVSTVPSADDPSAWTKAKIVDFYKKAAEKSNRSVKSEQIITLSDISVNNGQFEGVIDFVMPIMSKLLANNSTEKDGITGGFSNLSESDVYRAKAYKFGDNTAIEMVMHEQTDGAHGDALSGTVGHAISAVGDIGVVTDQLKDLGLPIEISEEHTSIHYTNPAVKVLIDSNGNIINGTWSYTVDIRLNNYKVGGKTVDTTSVIMHNVITVNGGFGA